MKISVHAVLGVVGLWGAAVALVDPALAQSIPHSNSTGNRAIRQPDPLDASVVVPQTIHRSAFAQYRILSDEKVGSWKDANDNVGRIGGWREYAKEANAPDSSAGQADVKPSPGQGDRAPQEAPQNQGGHGGHKPK